MACNGDGFASALGSGVAAGCALVDCVTLGSVAGDCVACADAAAGCADVDAVSAGAGAVCATLDWVAGDCAGADALCVFAASPGLYWAFLPSVPDGQPTPKQGPATRIREQPHRHTADMHRVSRALDFMLIVSSHENCSEADKRSEL